MWHYGLFVLAILSMVFAVGGVCWFFEGLAALRKKRLIENLPTSEIRSLDMGIVEVKGKAKAKKPMYSPISGTPCIYYTYKVEQWQSRKDGSRWVIIALGDSGEHCFYVDDNTAKVLVNPKDAKISSPCNDVQRFPDYDSLPQNLRSLIDQGGSSLLRFMRRSRGEFMFTENYIATEHEIYVLGTAEPMEYISQRADEKGYGVTGSTEDFVQQSLDQESNPAGKIVIRKGKEIPLLYISDRKEKDITQRMQRSSIRRIVGGPIILAASSFLIHHYYTFFLRYISEASEISLIFKAWILLGPVLLVLSMFILGYYCYDYTRTLIRVQGN